MGVPRPVYAAVVVAAALATAFVTGMVAFAVGLVVAEWFLLSVGRPVAALLTGVAAGLAAAWAANLLAPDRSRTRLAPALLWSVAGAAAGLAVFLLLVAARPSEPTGFALIAFAAVTGLAASAGALRARRPRGPLRRDAWVSLVLLVGLVAALYGVVGLACLLDACGA